MKILSVSPVYWPAFQFGGPVISMHGMNKALVNKGIDVNVYTTNAGLSEKVQVNRQFELDGVKVTYFAFTNFFEFLGTTGWQFSRPLTMALRRDLINFDLVYLRAVWNYPTAIGAYYSRKYRKPYIISATGKLFPKVIRTKSWKKWPYYAFVAKRDLVNAAAIHYVTEYEKRICHAYLGLKNPAVFLPNGLDMSEFEPLPYKNDIGCLFPSHRGKTIILFMGRIHWIKGLDILVRGYSRLARERDDVHLLIAGPDVRGYMKKLKTLINDCGMKYADFRKGMREPYTPKSEHTHAKVTFTGVLDQKDKLKVLAASDIFVMPSYSEGFSNAVLESMACELPVVISNQCHFPEVSEKAAGIIINNDPTMLAIALRTLIEDKELRQRMGKNGRRLIKEKYTWDKIAEQLIMVYEKVLAKHQKLEKS